MGLRRLLCAVLAGALAVPAAAAAQDPAVPSGPPGTSADKVLVLGLDGTRIDKVEEAVRAGRAPHLASIARDGFAVPSLLAYQPPEAATISEVGWSSVAAGVWPDKHGVRGLFLNNDPGQAAKGGYPDFLTRVEALRPQLSTFLASDWANIGLPRNGGPIFGTAADARFALAAPDDVEAWDAADRRVAEVAAAHLRESGPDASFVYLGVIDTAAHQIGSATPRYLQAIADTDRRIGDLLAAIRSRPSYRSERWTVIVTTDHGQQHLGSGSQLSHGLGSNLERMSFVAAAGPGIDGPPPFAAPQIVDVAPTVLARLGLPIDPAWGLDGRPFATAAPAPDPVGSATRSRRSVTVRVRAPQGAPDVRSVRLAVPAAVRVRAVRVTPAARVVRRGRTVTVTPRGPHARAVRVVLVTRRPARPASVRATVTGGAGETARLVLRAR